MPRQRSIHVPKVTDDIAHFRLQCQAFGERKCSRRSPRGFFQGVRWRAVTPRRRRRRDSLRNRAVMPPSRGEKTHRRERGERREKNENDPLLASRSMAMLRMTPTGTQSCHLCNAAVSAANPASRSLSTVAQGCPGKESMAQKLAAKANPLRIADCGLRIADWGPRPPFADCGLRIRPWGVGGAIWLDATRNRILFPRRGQGSGRGPAISASRSQFGTRPCSYPRSTLRQPDFGFRISDWGMRAGISDFAL